MLLLNTVWLSKFTMERSEWNCPTWWQSHKPGKLFKKNYIIPFVWTCCSPPHFDLSVLRNPRYKMWRKFPNPPKKNHVLYSGRLERNQTPPTHLSSRSIVNVKFVNMNTIVQDISWHWEDSHWPKSITELEIKPLRDHYCAMVASDCTQGSSCHY
jgi:hypothetical protein